MTDATGRRPPALPPRRAARPVPPPSAVETTLPLPAVDVAPRPPTPPTPEGPAAPAPSAEPERRVVTVRVRVLAAVLAATCAALAVSGWVAALLGGARVDARIDDDLRRNAEQVRLLAADGVDPQTGGPFASAHELVVTAMSRTVPARTEGMLALQDGAVTVVAADSVVLRPEDDAELVARLADPALTASARLLSVPTAVTDWRVAVIPVRPADATTAADGTTVLVLAYDRTAERGAFVGIFGTYAAVAAVAAALVAVVGWVVAGRLLRPVRLLGRTARSITDTDLSARLPVRGNDDVAELTRAFNAMLDRIQAAVGAQRALLDDVGHELRTPLTVVRGHVELMDTADPADAQETRELVLDELDRMGRLMDDLLTLATVGSPDFVRFAPHDVGALTDTVSGNVRPLGRRRWGVEARAEGTALVDAQRLTQAWLQLAANAVKFSDEGSTILLGSRVVDDHLELWVTDEGVGIAPADVGRVFERFARADEDDERPGAGLGLAIVAAIAHAHGGTADVVSTPGRGSTFTVRVPLAGPPSGATPGPAAVPTAAAPTAAAPTSGGTP
ncbi:HAMP domain-containing protein [Cellulomonas sp. JZ18]|uniref:sensor histidine kinase n=1 Tax=Cellulomonas sp. JZ18 TaxID=2654191 RepID=UPI0012D3A16F|nr:HAMP domain-containing sensor histidine kinase [Cellulomonas sp. JZ18]QGQ20441.1 HAMP domain-containing protein [Cellulomonas sp. JZ18]